MESSSSIRLPAWLESLLSETFFNACMIHEDAKKNEKNIFCLDCGEAICHQCHNLHNSHRLLQGYTTNSAKVVFLNPRPQTRACRNLINNCISCERGLQDPYLFCAISCKINQIMRNNGMMSEYLHECAVLTLPEPGSDDWFTSPDPVFEPFACLATTEIVRKKRTSKFEIPAAAGNPNNSTALEIVSRRKGMPRRSPFN